MVESTLFLSKNFIKIYDLEKQIEKNKLQRKQLQRKLNILKDRHTIMQAELKATETAYYTENDKY